MDSHSDKDTKEGAEAQLMDTDSKQGAEASIKTDEVTKQEAEALNAELSKTS